MARLVRGNDVVDLWIDDRLDGTSLMLREGDRPARVLPTLARYSATSEYCRALSERLRAGWQRVRDPIREPEVDDEPREPGFEAALAANPGDAGAALVYADWYQHLGHPRGDVIAVQAALASRPDDLDLQAEQVELLREWRDYLLGPLGAPRGSHRLGLALGWEHGFIRRATLEGYGGEGDAAELVWELLRHPSARFLRELALGSDELYFTEDASLAIDHLLCAGPTPPLRSLACGSMVSNVLGDLTGLGERYPALEEVILCGLGDALLGDLRLPRVRRFAFRTASLHRVTLQAILAADWPALEELELWVGARSLGADCALADLAPLLTGPGMPELRILRVMNTELTDELCPLLAGSPRLPRLQTLDLSLGTLSDVGVDVIVGARAAFAGLRSLVISRSSVTPAGLRRLHATGLPIVDHGDDAPGTPLGHKTGRYISVAE